MKFYELQSEKTAGFQLREALYKYFDKKLNYQIIVISRGGRVVHPHLLVKVEACGDSVRLRNL